MNWDVFFGIIGGASAICAALSGMYGVIDESPRHQALAAGAVLLTAASWGLAL